MTAIRVLILELVEELLYNGDGLYMMPPHGYISLKDAGLITRDDVLSIISDIPKVADKQRRRYDIDEDDIETVSELLFYLVDGFNNDDEIFINIIKMYHELFKLASKHQKRTFTVTEGYERVAFHRYSNPDSYTAKLLGRFTLETSTIDTAEKYILNNLEDFLVNVVYIDYDSLKSKRDGIVRSLCNEFMLGFPFTQDFILENYKLFIPWILIKNSNIKNNQLISECIFGKMTSYKITEIVRYINNDNTLSLNISDDEATASALAYLLINKEGEN